MNTKQMGMLIRCFPLILLGLVGCGPEPRIQGKVVDVFGDGLPEVTVSIPNSQYRATTDEHGVYSLDYVPGEFEISFSKDDHETEQIKLNISEKSPFAAGDVELLPSGDLLGISDEQKAIWDFAFNADMIYREHKKGSSARDWWTAVYLTGAGDEISPRYTSGQLRVIDRINYWIELFKPQGNPGLVIRESWLAETSKIHDWYQPIEPLEEVSISENGANIRTYSLPPGKYAFLYTDQGKAFSGKVVYSKEKMANMKASTFYVLEPPNAQSAQGAKEFVEMYEQSVNTGCRLNPLVKEEPEFAELSDASFCTATAELIGTLPTKEGYSAHIKLRSESSTPEMNAWIEKYNEMTTRKTPNEKQKALFESVKKQIEEGGYSFFAQAVVRTP